MASEEAGGEELEGSSEEEEGQPGEEGQGRGGPLFTTPGVRRLVVIDACERAVGGFRPSFEYRGRVVELEGVGPGASLGRVARLARGKREGEGVRVCVRYEPPSPKFSRKRPGCASYRLTVSRGSDYIFSTRGLPSALAFSRKHCVAVWGTLELAFPCPHLLLSFVSSLKHVSSSSSRLSLILLLLRRPCPSGSSPLPLPGPPLRPLPLALGPLFLSSLALALPSLRRLIASS